MDRPGPLNPAESRIPADGYTQSAPQSRHLSLLDYAALRSAISGNDHHRPSRAELTPGSGMIALIRAWPQNHTVGAEY
jgi:hypothetical protein